MYATAYHVRSVKNCYLELHRIVLRQLFLWYISVVGTLLCLFSTKANSRLRNASLYHEVTDQAIDEFNTEVHFSACFPVGRIKVSL